MTAHARRVYPLECCGLLIGHRPEGDNETRTPTRIAEAENVTTESPSTRYLIDPKRFHEVDKTTWNTDEEILGFYHSHPDSPALPSAFDAEQAALWPGYCYLILGLSPSGELQEARAWVWQKERNEFEEAEVT